MSDPFDFIAASPQSSTSTQRTTQNNGKDVLSDLDVFASLGLSNSSSNAKTTEITPVKKYFSLENLHN